MLDGGVTSGAPLLKGPQPCVPAASSTARQSHSPCSNAIHQDRQSLAAPSQPPQKLLILMPLPDPAPSSAAS